MRDFVVLLVLSIAAFDIILGAQTSHQLIAFRYFVLHPTIIFSSPNCATVIEVPDNVGVYAQASFSYVQGLDLDK